MLPLAFCQHAARRGRHIFSLQAISSKQSPTPSQRPISLRRCCRAWATISRGNAMDKFAIAVLGACVLSLTGCGRDGPYRSFSAKDGETYIVNTWTGNVRKLANDEFIEVRDARPHLAAETKRFSIALDNLGAVAQGKYRCDPARGMLFQIEFAPNARAKVDEDYWVGATQSQRDSAHSLNINFYDPDGFAIATQSMSMDAFSGVVGDGGKTQKFSYEGSVPVDATACQRAAMVNVGWSGFWLPFQYRQPSDEPK